MRVAKRIGDPRQPGIVGRGTPIVQLGSQVGEHGRVCRMAGEIHDFVRIRRQVVQLFRWAMRERLQRAFPQFGARRAGDGFPW